MADSAAAATSSSSSCCAPTESTLPASSSKPDVFQTSTLVAIKPEYLAPAWQQSAESTYDADDAEGRTGGDDSKSRSSSSANTNGGFLKRRKLNNEQGGKKSSGGAKPLQICRAWQESGSCKYGDACKFAHVREGETPPEPAAEAVASPIRLCHFIGKGMTCSYGDSCSQSHDLTAYMAQKPRDLMPTCPVWARTGACETGFMCRYASSHPTVESFRPSAGSSESAETVVAQPSLMKSLQRRTYRFQGVHRREAEAAKIEFRDQIYVAPLTTVGNLPYRRLLVDAGADITCGEMALAYNVVRGIPSEWALMKRHPSEKIFGVQLAGCDANDMAKAAELISRETRADFIDLNAGCPVDMVTHHGAGSALLRRPNKIYQLIGSIHEAAPSLAIGLKMRMGWDSDKPTAHNLIAGLKENDVASKLAYVAVHGRYRRTRYTKPANLEYVRTSCVPEAHRLGLSLWVNGDVFDYRDYEAALAGEEYRAAGALLARGALIKPWLCTEIKERRVWDISSQERFQFLEKFASYGLEHWGSDTRGVDTTRRYLLEWLSFAHRYVPVGLIEANAKPQGMCDRPPRFVGRNDLETLMGSNQSKDWEKLVEMVLGKPDSEFVFVPKHKSNAWTEEPPATAAAVALD